jgi:beta-lactamase regulating signal transducer with metallopeptidase domain
MASLNSWLSVDVMHALGWALIHSLWQCLGVAALAAALMAFSRRPSLRYLIAVGALVAILAVPVATFFVLMKSAASAHAVQPAHALHLESPGTFAAAGPATTYVPPAVSAAPSTGNGMTSALENLPRPSPNLLPWLVGAWFAGVALFSLRFAGGFLLLEHKRRRQSNAPSPRILAMCRELQRQLGLDRAIRYLECGWLQAPAVIGWFRPVILLPLSALTGLTEEQLRAVIAHELAHIRRLDAFVNLFQILVETLLFYHPAMWWLNKRIRDERELCCDEIAVSLTGSRVEYARALTLMAAWRNAPVLAMAANRGPLSQRVLHILGRKPSGAGQRMMGLTGGALFLTAALAAANALFGIAYPIPTAQAKQVVSAALLSGQVAVDHAVRQALQAATKNVEPASGQEIAAQIEPAKTSQAEALAPLSPDLSRLLRHENLATPTLVASAVMTPNSQAAAATLLPADPTARPATAGSNELPTVYRCNTKNVSGLVISPVAIRLQGFSCFSDGSVVNFGSCPNARPDGGRPDLTAANRLRGTVPSPSCKFTVIMNVQLAKPADASKMQPGKIVRLAGDFRIARENHVDYLTAGNANILYVDPFDPPAAAVQPASKAPPAAAIVSNDQPVVQPTTQTPPAGPVQATLNTPAATPAKAGSDEPVIYRCNNRGVFGRVISSKAIQMQGFRCFLEENPGNNGSPVSSARDLSFGSCPDASTQSEFGNRQCRFDVAMNVRLADLDDAAKMQAGKMVRLAGDFRVTRKTNVDYLTVENASVSVPSLECQPPELDALSKELGRLCVQSDILANLNVTRPALEAAARALVGHLVRDESSGDPDAIICHKRVYVRLPSSLTCAHNDYWAFDRQTNPSMGQFPDVGTFYNPGNTGGSGPVIIGGAGWQL